MIELCQPPDPAPRTPKLILPPGATDCHVHVYGPAAKYPVAPTRAFDVPDALPQSLSHLLDVLGVQRVVLVQPSGYGIDNRRHLDAVAEVGRPARVIASLRADTPERELTRLHDLGVRGVRYTIGHAGAAPLAEMPVLSQRIAEMGWHVQLHVMNDGGKSPLLEMERTLASLASDLVIDHIGSVRPALGLEQDDFSALRRLVDGGRCWVKLSCGYRLSNGPAPYLDMVPFVKALTDARPDRMLWASDWPHVFFKGKMPNTTDLLDQMRAWVPDEGMRHQIFVDNPARLYGF